MLRAAFTPVPVCHGMARVTEIFLFPIPCHYRGMEMEELGLSLTKCSNLENGPCMSPDQDSKADHFCVSVCELNLKVPEQKNWP